MDPVTHTLVGAALAQSGLKRRTALGTAMLLIGANLPDIDMLAYFWSPVTALWFRRGVTHGILALLVLPVLLTGVMLLWDRLVRRGQGRAPAPPVVPRQICLLAVLAVASHPILDSLNVYGMRWLMPFADVWFYGDTLFIVDPWMWAVLAAGVFLVARPNRNLPDGRGSRSAGRPAIVALALFGAYVGAMAASNLAARRTVRTAIEQTFGRRPERMMVSPLPVDPFTRWVVMQDGPTYRFGTYRWLRRPHFVLEDYTLDRYPPSPAAAAATRGPEARKFLSWARFPYFRVEERPDRWVVRIGDARYTLDPEESWAAISVVVER